MMLAKKIFALHARKPEHFGDLVKRQDLLAIAFKREGFKHPAGHIPAQSGKPLGNIVREVERNVHCLNSSTRVLLLPAQLGEFPARLLWCRRNCLRPLRCRPLRFGRNLLRLARLLRREALLEGLH